MSLTKLLGFLHRHRRTLVRGSVVLLALLVCIDLIPGAIDKQHAHTAVERLPGFWAGFGLVGCALLIILSKAFGHAGIMQREDYYDD